MKISLSNPVLLNNLRSDQYFELAAKIHEQQGIYIWGFKKGNKNYWYYSGYAKNLLKRIVEHQNLFSIQPTYAIIERANDIKAYYEAIHNFNHLKGELLMKSGLLCYTGRKKGVSEFLYGKNAIIPQDLNYYNLSIIKGGSSNLSKKITKGIISFSEDIANFFCVSYAIIDPSKITFKEGSMCSKEYKVTPNDLSFWLGLAEYNFKNQLEKAGIFTLGKRNGPGISKFKIQNTANQPCFTFDLTPLF